jgi:hypothetical protein
MAEQNGSVLPSIPFLPDAGQTSSEVSPQGINITMGPSSKDVIIGAGALFILAIVIFFIRNSFVNYLVGPSMKRSPNNAGMAGWGLFGGLFFGAAFGCFALFSKNFLTMPIIISFAVFSSTCFVIMFVTASKK